MSVRDRPDALAAHAARTRTTVGESVFHGVVACTTWPRAAVADALPPGARLDEAGPHGRHPVGVLFGDQTDARTLLGGFAIPLGTDYRELAVVAPAVRLENGRRYTFVLGMFADYFPVVWNGSVRYGFGKEHARLGWRDDTFVVTRRDGTLVFHAAIGPRGPWRSAGASRPLVEVERWFADPILGYTTGGRFVTTTFHWSIGQTLGREVAATFAFEACSVPRLGSQRWLGAADATVEVRGLSWSVGWPTPLPRP